MPLRKMEEARARTFEKTRLKREKLDYQIGEIGCLCRRWWQQHVLSYEGK